MAISANTNLDVRTTGSDTNGGGFVKGASGTDYSQQNSAQNTGTLGTATGTTAFSDAGYTFLASDVGNLIHINSGAGFTPGFYQIVSVTTGVATLDRSPGTGTVAHWSEGGALATLATAISAMVPSNVCWIKSGTYTQTSTLGLTSAISGGGSGSVGPTVFVGFNSTHGDLGTKPLITTATNSTPLWMLTNANTIVWRNLSMSNTASTRANGIATPTSGGALVFNLMVDRCILDGFTTGMLFDDSPVYGCEGLTISRTEIKNCATAGVNNTFDTTFIDCYLHGNGSAFLPGTFASTINCSYTFLTTVFYSNTRAIDMFALSVSAGQMVTAVGCVFSDNTNDGIRTQNSSFDPVNYNVKNCIFYNNGGYGVNVVQPTNNGYQAPDSNAYGANTSGAGNNWVTADITLSGDPFNGRTSNDFSLNNTSGAGASCRAAGYPGVAPFGTSTGLDVGALQSGGGAGTTVTVIAPTINQYIQEV